MGHTAKKPHVDFEWDDFPESVRVAGKGREFHILWPGDLAGPFIRSGYQIFDYERQGHTEAELDAFGPEGRADLEEAEGGR